MSYFDCPPAPGSAVADPNGNGNGSVETKSPITLSLPFAEAETYFLAQQMSLMMATGGCDQNGNILLAPPPSVPERQRPPTWSTGAVKHNLRTRLNQIKQVQNESQNHFHDAQNNYRSFATCCRNQLDLLLQEWNRELEQTFRKRIMELNHQRCQVEELLAMLGQESNNGATNNKSGMDGEEGNFLATFDQDSVNVVRNVLAGPVPALVDVQVPNVDPATMEQMLRSLLLPLIRQQQQQQQQPFYPEVGPPPPHHHHASSSFNHDDSDTNNNDSYDNNHHHSFAVWHQAKQQPMSNHHLNDFYLPQQEQHPNQLGGSPPELVLLNQKQALTKSLQPRIRRERISYYLKFGEQGAHEGQFAEPSGVAVNPVTDEIYIADANNHRVQVFDKWGKFRLHFGDGKLKFPNRVALSRNTGDVVVSERPPVHQIQVYNKNGAFVCKFGAKHLRHPRGLTVDHRNRVVVVECKVMRVFIFSLTGVLQHSFDCSEQIQFPNAVAVSKQEEIYISDNRNHCVKVFNFNGEFLRQIGGHGITNYPIGVCLNEPAGQLLVIDNYNNLNVTVFRLDGQLMAAYESSAKHQQCLDVALFGDHSLVVTSKDLQVYLYRLHHHHQQQNNHQQFNHHHQHQNVNGPPAQSSPQYPLTQQQQKQQSSTNNNGTSGRYPVAIAGTPHPAIIEFFPP